MQVPGRTSIPRGTVGGGTAYTDAQVLAALGKGGLETWVFDRLDASGRYLSDLSSFVAKGTAPTVIHDTTAAVKRTLTITLRGDAPLAALSEMIRPHYRLAASDGGWLDFALGTFLPNAPTRTIERGVTSLTFIGSDYGQLLVDAPFMTATAAAAGASYASSVRTLMSGYGGATLMALQMPEAGQNLPIGIGWTVGESRLAAINTLLGAVAYTPLWFDEVGVGRSDPIPDYAGLSAHLFRVAGPIPGLALESGPGHLRARVQHGR